MTQARLSPSGPIIGSSSSGTLYEVKEWKISEEHGSWYVPSELSLLSGPDVLKVDGNHLSFEGTCFIWTYQEVRTSTENGVATLTIDAPEFANRATANTGFVDIDESTRKYVEGHLTLTAATVTNGPIALVTEVQNKTYLRIHPVNQ